MPGLEAKHADSPDETRMFAANGHMAVVSIGGVTAMRGVFEPGWKWSEHVKPIAKTDSCQATHAGYVVSGRMKVVMDDGTEGEAVGGDFVHIAPGHDAWTVGDEPCVMVDFGANVGQYAKQS